MKLKFGYVKMRDIMSKLTFPILELLADGQFHSGEVLAKHFKVSRASIWNAIKHAQTLGITVFSICGRGYKLPKAIDFIDKNNVLNAVGEQYENFDLIILDETASTNTYLMQQKNVAHATCVASHIQTSGRGRRGRIWVSQLGASLTFSLLWRFQCGAAALSGLSLAVGVAIIRALREMGIDRAQLKWPNDVLVLDAGAQDTDTNKLAKKLAGILIELHGDLHGPSVAVIGIGVNLNCPREMLENIDQPAIDLAHILTIANKPLINQSELLGVLLKHLFKVLSGFEKHGFVELRDEWTNYHAYHHQSVRMLFPNGNEITGVVNGVADDGVLLIETAQGFQRFNAGEISMRGMQ